VHIHILTYTAATSGQWLRKTTTAPLACGLVAQSKSLPLPPPCAAQIRKHEHVITNRFRNLQ